MISYLQYNIFHIISTHALISTYLDLLELQNAILMGFKNARLTSCYILQKTIECKLSLLR